MMPGRGVGQGEEGSRSKDNLGFHVRYFLEVVKGQPVSLAEALCVFFSKNENNPLSQNC